MNKNLSVMNGAKIHSKNYGITITEMKMSKLYKNWPIHNLIAHPVSELAYWVVRPFSKVRAEKVSKLIHDSTLPEGFEHYE